jgi:hypothetical protein
VKIIQKILKLTGVMIALNINHYFWWVGLLIGMITGYLSYEFKTVISIVPKAYQKAKEWRAKRKQRKIDPEVVKSFWLFATAFLITFIGSRSASYFNDYLEALGKTVPKFELTTIIIVQVFVVIFMFLSGGMSLAFMLFGLLGGEYKKIHKEVTGDTRNMLWSVIKYGNVIIGPFVVFYFTFKALYFLFRKIYANCWNAIKISFQSIGQFFKFIFLFIHSEARIICGVDAGVGVCIGYYFNSPIIGAIAGAVFGVLNYYVVSIKILKLQPKI